MVTTDNLDAWPSDDRKFNVVEFYHKILWASQQNEQIITPIMKEKGGNRVTFSTEPPVIYEYEPEYSKANKRTSFFNYQNFKPQQGEYYYSQPPMNDYDDDGLFQNHRLMKTRSLSEFKPIPNQDFNHHSNSVAPCYQSPTPMYDDDDDPPPSYIEYNVYSNMNHNFFESNYTVNNSCNTSNEQCHGSNINHCNDSNNLCMNDNIMKKNVIKKENTLWAGQAFFQRTLRKIKSSPRLMVIQRRSSMASLRKKKSFLS